MLVPTVVQIVEVDDFVQMALTINFEGIVAASLRVVTTSRVELAATAPTSFFNPNGPQ